MSFEIQIAPLSHFELVRLIDTSTKTVIEIATKGALLNSWQVMGHSKSMEIVEGNDFSKGWGDFEAGGFKGGKMSPFSCRIQNGQYTFEDKTYTIEKFYHEKHALHGILYDALFSVELSETDDQGAYLHLKYHYEATDKGFPFAYTVLIKWHLLKNNVVTAETIITNLTDSTIPMMDGWHPYFKLGKTINDCTLQFINKGISGQTTPQILKRFGSDISIEKVKSVIILAGINDIAQNTGPITITEIANNV
mgnify:CR=1 FL=1